MATNKPNKKTIAAMRELERGVGKVFKTTKDLFNDWKNMDDKAAQRDAKSEGGHCGLPSTKSTN